MIEFSTTQAESYFISKIVDRSEAIAKRFGKPIDRVSLRMDITATHKNGNPLRLRDLLEADDLNFTHDVFGIERHLDRRTGQLADMFRPRFSKTTD